MWFISTCPRAADPAGSGSSVWSAIEGHYSVGGAARTPHSGSAGVRSGKALRLTGNRMGKSGTLPDTCIQAELPSEAGARIKVSRGSSPNTRR